MTPPPINPKLVLEWATLSDGRPALAFDKATWLVYEETAATRGQTAQQMITASVAAALGPILANNDSRPALDRNAIRAKLVEFTLLATARGIDIESVFYEALGIADVEPC
jgi:hypothetical protein